MLALNIKGDGVFDYFEEAESLIVVEEDLGLSTYLSCVEINSRYFLKQVFCSENLHKNSAAISRGILRLVKHLMICKTL